MAVVKRMCPDGKGGFIELYSAPLTTRDANAWLDRIGNKRVRFSTVKGIAYLNDVGTGKVLVMSHNIYELCWFITSTNKLRSKFGVINCDWYRAPDVYKIDLWRVSEDGYATIFMKSLMSETLVKMTPEGTAFNGINM